MEKERQSRRFIIPFLIFFVRLSHMVHLCSFSVVAQSNSVVPPSRRQRSWIVGYSGEGNVNGDQSLFISCTDLCLNALSPIYGESLIGLSVEMYSCEDGDNSLFQYNDSSKAITMWDATFHVNRCLDSGKFPHTNEFRITLQNCNASAANQQWFIQDDGKIRCGLVNSSSSLSGQPLYMQFQPQGWGRGWNTLGLYLGSGENSDTITTFIFLPYVPPPPVSQLTVAPTRPPFNSTADMILNGDFERCGCDPGQSDRADLSSNIWWFTVCSWEVTSGSVQLVGPGLWEQTQAGGNAALHLNGNNGPGTIIQSIYTDSGSNYSLSFDFAGDVTISCGSTIKTFDVSISPSDFPRLSLSFNVSDKIPTNMGWMSTPLLNFVANGTSVNITFQSTTDGSCGPLIDNVVVIRRFQEVYSSVAEKEQTNGSNVANALKVTVAVLGVGLVTLASLALFCCYRIYIGSHLSIPFVKGKQAEMDSLDTSFTSGSESGSTHVDHYSWQELETATNNFTKVIGKGGYGLLYMAEFPDGLLGAVKVDVHQRQWPSEDAFRQEVTTLQRVHHAYLLNLIGVCVGEGCRRALVFEYMPNGNLHDRLHMAEDKEPLAWQIRMVIAYQVACALEYLHEVASPPIVHCDLKASSVLLQRDDSAKLADFEVSRSGRSYSSFETMSPAGSVRKGTYRYLDPASQRTGRISKKSDVYSYGALLLELTSGLPADHDSKLSGDFLMNLEEMDDIVDPKLLGKFNRHELSVVIEIVGKCLKSDGRSRPSMSDVVFMLKEGFASSRPLA